MNQNNSMFSKGNKLYSIINNKCPHCHEGQYFKSNNAYSPTEFNDMNPSCPVCGQKYELEPGFYYGAMYVSYALNVAIMVTLWVAIEVLSNVNLPIWKYIVIIVTPSFLAVPLTYRIARLIWINFFVHYSKSTVASLKPHQN